MNFLDLIKELDTEQLDGEKKDRFLDRKEALGKMSNFGKKLAISALPLGAFAAFNNTAQAQSTSDLAGVLNFALTLEYLEAEFYQMGVDSGVVDSYGKSSVFAHGDILRGIADHEADHVAFLQDVIGNVLEETPIDKPTFDFTGGQGSYDGPFDPFNDGPTFLILAQAFEDTGVRAYKGQAGRVQGNDLVLTRALQIHSVEARHAARVRQLRADVDLTGWISGPASAQGVPDAALAVYQGATPETNKTQVVDVSTTIGNQGDVDPGDIAEAWDEPLTMDEVLAIGRLFIVPEDDG